MQLESNKQSRNSVVSNAVICSLPVRTNKPCTSLAFSCHNPSLLAAGFDKAKNEPGLIVWDLETSTTILSHAARPQATSSQSRTGGSAKFDVATKNHYATTEFVSSVSFLPESADLLVAGVSNLSLRIYDLRASGHKTQTAVPTKASGIAMDPFGSSIFASFGDNTVSVWDWRKIAYPLLSFSSNDAAADGARIYSSDHITCIEFSATRRGTLATLTRGNNYVRFWDIHHAPSVIVEKSSEDQRSVDANRDISRTSKIGRLSWSAPTLPWTAPVDQTRIRTDPSSNSGSIVLANTYCSMLYIVPAREKQC